MPPAMPGPGHDRCYPERRCHPDQVAPRAGLALMLFTPWYGGSELLERFPHSGMPYRAEQAGQDDRFRTRSECGRHGFAGLISR